MKGWKVFGRKRSWHNWGIASVFTERDMKCATKPKLELLISLALPSQYSARHKNVIMAFRITGFLSVIRHFQNLLDYTFVAMLSVFNFLEK
jgi:hypothetical protein